LEQQGVRIDRGSIYRKWQGSDILMKGAFSGTQHANRVSYYLIQLSKWITGCLSAPHL
jgi:hypothetical protein